MSPLLAARLGAWLLGVTGAGALMAAFTSPVVLTRAAPASVPPPQEAFATRRGGDLDAAAALVAERDLFRRSRRPGPRGGTSPDPGGLAQPLTGSPRPPLRLLGLVAGARPAAVIEGLPHTTGPRVVAPGEVFAGLTIRRISAAGVEVAGPDTTWLLTVRRR